MFHSASSSAPDAISAEWSILHRISDSDFDEACAIRHALEMPEESITRRLAESHLKELGDIEAQKDADRKRNEQAALDALAAAYEAQKERYKIELKRTTERKEKGCT